MEKQWNWQSEKLPTVVEGFNETCDKFPDRYAQLFNPDLYGGDHNGKMTWSEMRQRVDLLACGLMSLGIEAKDNISIMAQSSPYWTQADMAIASIGAVSVTIYPTLSFRETSYIINDSKSRFIFAGSVELLEKILPEIDSMPNLERIIVMDRNFTSDDERVTGFGELIDLGADYRKESSHIYEERKKSVKIDDNYTILYTSGTTGQGKGVILKHWNASSRISGVREFFDKYGMTLTENDCGLCFLPLSHIFDRGSLQLAAIFNSSTIAYADKPGTLIEDMQKYNPTWINCVPRLYEKIYINFNQQLDESPLKKKLFGWALKVGSKALEYRKDEKGRYNMSADFDLASKLPFGLRIKFKIADKLFAKVRALFGNRFRFSFSASAAISPELLIFFYTLGIPVCEGYGSTESFNACVLNPVTKCKPGFVGIEANGSFARIAPDGELEISGAGIFSEYLNKPEATEESFTKDGWFKTGDIVVDDDEGYYRIVDRKKAIICTSIGKNVAPAKLESYFATSSLVEQIFLVGDNRNFITALIVPAFEFFINIFDKQGFEYNKDALIWSKETGKKICMGVGEDFIANPIIREMIEKEVDEINEKLEKFERIKKFAVLKDKFSEINSQLTPTMKLKKIHIIDSYKDIIEEMYNF